MVYLLSMDNFVPFLTLLLRISGLSSDPDVAKSPVLSYIRKEWLQDAWDENLYDDIIGMRYLI